MSQHPSTTVSKPFFCRRFTTTHPTHARPASPHDDLAWFIRLPVNRDRTCAEALDHYDTLVGYHNDNARNDNGHDDD
jgi:hypothetical protein